MNFADAGACHVALSVCACRPRKLDTLHQQPIAVAVEITRKITGSGNGRCVMKVSTRVFARAAGFTVALTLGGCADSDFWTTDPAAWLTASKAQPEPTT